MNSSEKLVPMKYETYMLANIILSFTGWNWRDTWITVNFLYNQSNKR